MTDPNVPDPVEEEVLPAPEPQAPPPLDVDSAYRVIAEAEGWDPRLTRFEMQELKRKKEDLDRREREFQERNAYRAPEPTPDFGGDVYLRGIHEAKQGVEDMKRMLLAREQREQRQAEEQRTIQELGVELDSEFVRVARRSGMSGVQIEAAKKDFFETLTDLYPEPDMIKRMGPGRVVDNSFRVFRSQANGYTAPATKSPYRDPRASFTIPAGSSSGPVGDDAGPRRPNESQEEYVSRLKRVLDEAGGKMSTLPERAVINPG